MITKHDPTKILTAMPVLIPQRSLTVQYVERWKNFAISKLSNAELLSRKLKDSAHKVYHAKKSKTAGVFFISDDGVTIDYLYAYQPVKLEDGTTASEALAFNFNTRVRGVTREIFFGCLMKEFKLVVTDSLYTPDGLSWFESIYDYAFGNKARYNVYAIDLKINKRLKISRDEFNYLQRSFWGMSDQFQEYRFAVERR
jgi:hypothetical protein